MESATDSRSAVCAGTDWAWCPASPRLWRARLRVEAGPYLCLAIPTCPSLLGHEDRSGTDEVPPPIGHDRLTGYVVTGRRKQERHQRCHLVNAL